MVDMFHIFSEPIVVDLLLQVVSLHAFGPLPEYLELQVRVIIRREAPSAHVGERTKVWNLGAEEVVGRTHLNIILLAGYPE